MIFNYDVSDLQSEVNDVASDIVPFKDGVYCVNATDKNLNNYTNPGTYFFGEGVTNGPGFNWFVLQVIRISGYIFVQIAISADATIIMARTSLSNWGNGWQKVYDVNDDTDGVAYTPSIFWSSASDNLAPTVSDVYFVYRKVSRRLVYITGRFYMSTKNTTANKSLMITLPTGIISNTSCPVSMGVVYESNQITRLVVRTEYQANYIYLASGAGGNYASPEMTENRWYSITALIPIIP